MELVRGTDRFRVSLEGPLLRVGDGGTETVRKFLTPEHARAQYEKIVAQRLGEGFSEAPDVIDDLAARLVHGDELQLKGDPQGELMALQHALAELAEDAPARQRRSLEIKIEKFLEDHHDALYGELAAFVRRPSRKTPTVPFLDVTWRLGFAEEVRIQRAPYVELDAGYVAFRKLPLSRTTKKLVVGRPTLASESSADATYYGLVDAVVRAGLPPQLKSLVWGDARGESWGHVLALGDLRPIVAAAPALEELEVTGANGTVGPLAGPRLRRLVLECSGASKFAQVGESALPALEDLTVRGSSGSADLTPLWTASLPKLARLTFRREYTIGADAIEALARSPLLPRLRELALVHCELRDPTLAAIHANAGAFAHLDRLDLRENHFTRALVTSTRKLLPQLQAGGR